MGQQLRGSGGSRQGERWDVPSFCEERIVNYFTQLVSVGTWWKTHKLYQYVPIILLKPRGNHMYHGIKQFHFLIALF
jgi:hypothetical protein